MTPRKQILRNGIIAALWIPTDENCRLKRRELRTHLAWLKGQNIHGVLALGSTGEFARMNLSQRETILEAIVQEAAPLPVIANISSLHLKEVHALGASAKRMGAAGVALMPPPFFPLSQDDILEFFLRAAERVPLPFYLYNYPEVLGNRIGPKVIEGFSARCEMIGIKQSGAELSYHKELIALGRKHRFSVFSAADPHLGEYLKMGAAGCIGGLANFVPELMLEVYQARGKVVAATSRLKTIGELLSALPLPLNVRSGMEARGFAPGEFKGVVSSSTLETYRQTVSRLRHCFQEWGLSSWAHHDSEKCGSVSKVRKN